MLKKIAIFLCFVVVLALCGAGGWLYWAVVLEPGEEIQAENIKNILGRESQVFYSDGVTKLGVFFDTSHRQYVSYGEIPTNFVNALTASEDDRFFEHIGFDVVGITRAMIKNIEAGKFIQGGSTLTQQTAKNLFKRTNRDLEAKLKELLYALRLEYHYSKEEIFEFYANQFYVSGNGHGLGVAARYYFDKTPSELTMVECAFIAGSVKRPNYYNPFRKKTEQGVALARERARERLHYVLGRMHELGMIDNFAYNKALAADIEFNNGKVGFALDYAMEMVRDAVSSNEVLSALEDHGISNIATSGARVITSVDRGLQAQTLSALREELSRLDVRLRGYEREEVQSELQALEYTGDSALEKGAFIFGEIIAIEGKGKDVQIEVALDKKLGNGVIEAEGLQKILTAWVKYRDNRWSEVGKKDLDLFMKQLEVGDRAWVSVVDDSNAGEPVSLSLERYPELQGAAVVIQQGKIKALAGGSENRFFNRATQAKRTMGSAFKPLVYAAALQLGWNSADLLKNTRDVFVYYDQPYYPRPDHKSPHEWVSMSWAGVHSENLASVWLLSNLCDKLTPLQFREVADRVGLGPKIIDGKQESYQIYRDRIRDKYGIQVTRAILRKTAFDEAVKNIEADFIFDGMIDEYTRIQQLHYGLHFDRYLAQLKKQLAEEKRPVKNYVVDEYQLKMGLLKHHYLKIEDLFRDLTLLRQKTEQSGQTDFRAAGDPVSTAGSAKLSASGSLYVSQTDGKFYFLGPGSMRSGLTPVTELRLQQYLKTLDRQQTSWFWENIELDGRLSVAAFTRLQEQLELEYASLLGRPSFDFEVLAGVEDFRITVGLYYLIELARQLGIKSTLEPVLSFPLGSNVVSLLEATRMYESLVSGVTTSFGSIPPDGSSNSEREEDFSEALAILDRIESEQGAVLFEPQAEVKKVIDAKTSLAIGSILENIVKFGTGRYAGSHVVFADKDDQQISEIEEMKLPVPLLGKTGTANLYTNAAFLGYVPEINDNGTAMTLKEGYAVGVYVGFDDNSPMRRNSSRITGSAGALPTWSSIANTLLLEEQYVARLDPVDLSFYGLAIKRDPLGQLNLAADTEAGGIVREPIQQVSDLARTRPSIITFGQISEHGGLVMERNYQPFWDNITADADQSDSAVLQQ